MTHHEDEGLDHAGDRFITSDRDLDALGDALLAWESREAFSRWWEHGSLDEDCHRAA
jgi:hypothetical protein